MLAGLFSKAWKSNSPEKRRQWILQADKTSSSVQTILLTLAKQDDDSITRHAAIDKLTSPLQVLELFNSHQDEITRQHASLVLAELIGVKSNITEKECRHLLLENAKINTAIVKHSAHAALRHELLNEMPEQQQSEIIANVAFTETRQFIAQNLVSREVLETAKRSLKGKDKSAEKIIKSKLDDLYKIEKQISDNKKLAEELCEKMEFLAQHDNWRPEFKGQYLLCEQQWRAKKFTPAESILVRYDSAHAIVSAEVQRRNGIDEAEQTYKQCIAELEANCNRLSSLSIADAIENQANYSKTLNGVVERWQQSNSIHSAEKMHSQKFSALQQGITSVINFLKGIEDKVSLTPDCSIDDKKNNIKYLREALADLSWPSGYPELIAKAEIENHIADLSKSKEQDEAIAKNNLDKLHKRINRLLGNTNRGNLLVARRELNAVNNAAKNYSGKNKSILEDRIEQATEAVKKMGDWQDFATEPKYLELCENMEALKKSKKHPEKLAKDIHDLQQKWKDLGHSESADEHWDRFKISADLAYEPCAVFFKQRLDTRINNLKKREPFIKKMRDLFELTEWDNEPDYKNIEAQIRNISNEWQKIKNVEPKQGQKQWQELSKYKSAIYEKLDVIYDKNIALKEQLITQTLALLSSDIQEQSITKLQHLQGKWKQVGITRRKQDQVAWKKFNKASDDVYAKIKGVRNDRRAHEDEQLDAYRQIINQINDLAKSTNTLAESDPKLEELRTQYDALPDLPSNLPEKLIKGLETDFRRSNDAYANARERIKKSENSKALDAVYQYAHLCEKLEELNSDTTAEKTEKIKTKMNAIIINDKKINARLQQRIEKSFESDRQQYYQARKEICIDLEILLEVDSPDTDRALRMEIQLKRLQTKGIGNNKSLKNTIDTFELDWLCLPGAETEQQKLLNKRFNTLIKLANKKT